MSNITLLNTTLSRLEAIEHSLAANDNITTTNQTSVCMLGPHARALSSILTSFVGTSLTGLSSGSKVAFQVGWVC